MLQAVDQDMKEKEALEAKIKQMEGKVSAGRVGMKAVQCGDGFGGSS